jgi:hypothetical protein
MQVNNCKIRRRLAGNYLEKYFSEPCGAIATLLAHAIKLASAELPHEA